MAVAVGQHAPRVEDQRFLTGRGRNTDDGPFCEIHYNSVLAKTNPLGIKGVGEAGAVGSVPAVMAAMCDALAPAGVSEIAMPATPTACGRH